ncbi:PQQ-binding-like beta-propeller repeat protein [Mycolicibacterium peregrinum]|uniref:PQQ-binding-like beta-propeller repeat protein n=1 Tax=Mycolicibacterium peregrinum TaxID=43304 RepID=UPI0013F4E8C6|nr:PQQ-binding-like beta-propeller repeat protein [Mycolicibacterium peregrinum]
MSLPPPPGPFGSAYPNGGGTPPAWGAPVGGGRRGLFAWIVAGVGVGLLVGALGVAGYSALRTPSLYCSTALCDEAAGRAEALGWSAVAVAAVIGVPAVWQLIRAGAVRRLSSRVRVIAAVCAVGLVIGVIGVGLASSEFAAAGPRIWLLRVVVGSTIVGCVLVGVSWWSAQGRRVGWATAGACAAVILVAVVAVSGARSTVVATTAAAVDIPATPETLGQEQFRLTVPYFRANIDAAGAGFIVWSEYWAQDSDAPALLAFDNAGVQRWHYGRGPDQKVGRVRVYDDDRIVVVGFAGDDERGRPAEVVGLDAVTGEQLWVSNDPATWNALDINDGGSPTSFMVRGKESWTGFNARTGEQLWEISNPVACGGGSLSTLSSTGEPYTVRVADVGDRLVTVNDCSTAGTINLRVVAHDAATGEQLGDWPIPGADHLPRDTWENLDVRSGVGDRVSVGLQKACAERDPVGRCVTPGESRHMLVNYLTGQSVEKPSGRVYPSSDGRGDYVFAAAADRSTTWGGRGRTTDLMNADGSLRCQFISYDSPGPAPVWLTDQFVFRGKPDEVLALNRDTCQVEDTVQWPFKVAKETKMRYVTTSRGATLFVQSYADSQVDIVGYAP